MDETAFRRRLKQGYARSRPFYERAGCRFFLRQDGTAAFKDAVRRYQARYRLEQEALKALR